MKKPSLHGRIHGAFFKTKPGSGAKPSRRPFLLRVLAIRPFRDTLNFCRAWMAGMEKRLSLPLTYTVGQVPVPRDPVTGLVIDYAYSGVIDRGLPDIQLPLVAQATTRDAFPIQSLSQQDTILVFQPGFFLPKLLPHFTADVRDIPGAAGCLMEAKRFAEWQTTFKYFGFDVYFVNSLPREIMSQVIRELGFAEMNFLNDSEYLFSEAWHLPVTQIDEMRYYERMTAVIPKQGGVEKIFSGLSDPCVTAESVLQYVIERHEVQQQMSQYTQVAWA